MTTPEPLEVSPGRWVAPPGRRPAWNWVPDGHGIRPRLDAVPLWVRLWYRTPFVDRFAYVWMWHHGGWWVHPHPRPAGPDDADGVR